MKVPAKLESSLSPASIFCGGGYAALLVITFLALVGGSFGQQAVAPGVGVVFNGPTPWIDVKAYGAKGDGTTNDATAINNAIAACPASGCTVFFPSTTGGYFITSSLNILSSQPGVKLLGECGVLGSSSSSPTCSHILANTAIEMLKVGDFTSQTKFHSGLVIQDLGFIGTSAVNPGGAIHLINTEDFALNNVHCAALPNGFCMLFDGGTVANSVTQFGVVNNPSVNNTRFPVQTKGNTSEINLYGGTLVCSTLNTIASIGMDIGFTNHTAGVSTGGEWGVFGTHIVNCSTAGVSMFNNAEMLWYGIMEQTAAGFTGTGTGFIIDGDLAGKPAGIVVGGGINNFSTGVQVNGTATQDTISGSVSNCATGVSIASTVSNIAITGPIASASTAPIVIASGATNVLTLSTSNYAAGTGGVAVGTQIPTDITMPEESAPPSPVSTPLTQRIFADSSTHDLSVKDSGGIVTDVENNSVLEFFCIGVFPSNAAATVVLIPGGSTINCAAGAPPAEIRVPFTGTLKNLYVSAVAGTGNEVVTVWANSSPTSLVCTVNQAANTQCSDTNVAHNVTITAGQTISLRVNNLPAAGGTLASMRASVQLH